jgi:hypothetical protein
VDLIAASCIDCSTVSPSHSIVTSASGGFAETSFGSARRPLCCGGDRGVSLLAGTRVQAMEKAPFEFFKHEATYPRPGPHRLGECLHREQKSEQEPISPDTEAHGRARKCYGARGPPTDSRALSSFLTHACRR